MDDLKKLQLIFQTLSDYNRLGIIRFICEKERSVGEIVKRNKTIPTTCFTPPESP